MTLRVTSAPPYYPVSRAEAKAWLNIDDDITGQDAVIDLLIAALTEQAENKTGRAFVQRSYELLLDSFPVVIELEKPPLLSVDYVKYIDLNGELQTLSASLYSVDTYREPGILEPEYLQSWPNTRDIRNAVQIGYTAGYAPGSPSDEAAYREAVPAVLKQWMQVRIATLYENREQLVHGNSVDIPRDFVDGLLDSLTVLRF